MLKSICEYVFSTGLGRIVLNLTSESIQTVQLQVYHFPFKNADAFQLLSSKDLSRLTFAHFPNNITGNLLFAGFFFPVSYVLLRLK